jgi:hypothetical protein
MWLEGQFRVPIGLRAFQGNEQELGGAKLGTPEDALQLDGCVSG